MNGRESDRVGVLFDGPMSGVFGGPLAGDGADPASARVAAVFAYNGLHLLLFVVAGLVFSWFVLEAERHPPYGWYVAAIAFVGGVFLNLVLIGAFAYGAVEGWEPPWARIVLAMALGAGAMGAYFYRTHSALWSTLEEKARSGAEDA